MRRLARFVIALLCVAPVLAQAAVTVQNLRQWRAPDHTRLVFDLSAPLEHRVFALTDPHRVVIDLENAEFAGALPDLDFTDPLLAAMRRGRSVDHPRALRLHPKGHAPPPPFLP